MLRLLRQWLAIGIAANDPLAECHRKSLVVLVSSVTACCGALWGLCFCALGHLGTAVIPWAYVGAITTGLFHTWLTKRTHVCVLLFLTGIIVCPMAVHVLEGGYAGSSFVLLWAFMGPFLGLVLQMPVGGAGLLWCVAAAAHLAAAVAEGLGWRLAFQAPPPPWVQHMFVAMNSAGPTGAMLLGACFFITLARRETHKAQELLLNILPQHIIEQLTAQAAGDEGLERSESTIFDSGGHRVIPQTCIAESQNGVTVLFADIVGFTALSSQVVASAPWIPMTFSAFCG